MCSGLFGLLLPERMGRPQVLDLRAALPVLPRAYNFLEMFHHRTAADVAEENMGARSEKSAEPQPRLFSFNSPHGACPACEGLGNQRAPSEAAVVRDAELSIRDGALAVTRASGGALLFPRVSFHFLEKVADAHGFSLDTPWCELPKRARRGILADAAVAIEAHGKVKTVIHANPGVLPGSGVCFPCLGRKSSRHDKRGKPCM